MVMDGWNTATCILYNQRSACFFASIQLSNIYIRTLWARQLFPAESQDWLIGGVQARSCPLIYSCVSGSIKGNNRKGVNNNLRLEVGAPTEITVLDRNRGKTNKWTNMTVTLQVPAHQHLSIYNVWDYAHQYSDCAFRFFFSFRHCLLLMTMLFKN